MACGPDPSLATDAKIRVLEENLGIQLLADFVSCMRIHDGQNGNANWLPELLEVQGVLPQDLIAMTANL